MVGEAGGGGMGERWGRGWGGRVGGGGGDAVVDHFRAYSTTTRPTTPPSSNATANVLIIFLLNKQGPTFLVHGHSAPSAPHLWGGQR